MTVLEFSVISRVPGPGIPACKRMNNFPKIASVTASLVLFMLCQSIFGLLADKIGIKTNMLLFSGLATLLVAPVLFALHAVTNPYAAFGLVVSGLLIASFYAPIAGIVRADLFPATVRALGVGLPYAVAIATFGGAPRTLPCRCIRHTLNRISSSTSPHLGQSHSSHRH